MDISKEYYTTLKNNLEKVFERVEKAVLRSKRRLEEVKILGASKNNLPKKYKFSTILELGFLGRTMFKRQRKRFLP